MKRIAILIILAAAVLSCTTARKLRTLKEKTPGAALTLAQERELPEVQGPQAVRRDTLKVTDVDGTELLIMKAVKDEATGEMVASEVLDAAVVTARFRNVAERRGEVDIEFQIIVTDSLQDSNWQLRFMPEMYVLEDTLHLDPVIITGEQFRKSQMRGYDHYNRFLESIARDSLHFIDIQQLEIFLHRNLPQIFKYKTDTTLVSEEEFASAFGVTEKQAIDHYTNKALIASNARKVKKKGKMWEKYVRNPIAKDGIRLDTVLKTDDGRFVYNYVQTIRTRPHLRNVQVVLKGDIRDPKEPIYTMPPSAPLTFYISSLSAFAKDEIHYKTMVVERKATTNTVCHIAFATGKSAVDERLGSNEDEIYRIDRSLASLLENDVFDIDSIVVTASCSPDGRYQKNAELAQKRSEGVTRYFSRFISDYRDSLEREKGFSVDEEGNIVHEPSSVPDIRFTPRSIPEDWDALSNLVELDGRLTEGQKEEYRHALKTSDPDVRERALRSKQWYAHVVKDVYPMLRTVRFDFHLARKGMVKDTVHTTVVDTTYMDGLQALKDHDYEKAVSLLGPYRDYNAAVAYVATDRNATARDILGRLEKTAQVNYMLAVICSREGDDQSAVQHYIHACKQDASYVHRGNLDPEISALIKRYNLNAQPEDEFDYSF